MQSYRQDGRSTKRSGFATFAAINILTCVVIAVIIFPPAAFGGFNPIAQLIYGALALSIVASLCLIIFRTKLTGTGRTMLATVAVALVLAAISPFIAAASRL